MSIELWRTMPVTEVATSPATDIRAHPSYEQRAAGRVTASEKNLIQPAASSTCVCEPQKSTAASKL